MKLLYRQFDYKKDIDWLYLIYNNSSERNTFLHDFVFSTKEEFEKLFLKKVLNEYFSFSIICDTTEVPLGFVYGHEYSEKNLHIKFSMYILPEYRSVGVGAIAGIYFVDHIFKSLPVRKVYETIFQCNQFSLINNIQAGFKREATLKEYLFLNGSFHDLIFLSISRRKFYELYGENKIIKQ